MKRYPRLIAFGFIIWSFLVLSFFQERSFAPALRYSRVAEGNISMFVGEIWNNGFNAYTAILREDARQWGRVRPGHWLFYMAPFTFTLIRNGDLFRLDPNVRIGKRINGDLQSHVLFLIAALAIAAGVTGWLVWRISGVWGAALLLPFFIAASLILSENLLINYCDSSETGQLLFIGLYIAGIYKSFRGKVPKKSHELFASLCLLIAYAMKETTVVLFPVVIVIFGLRTLPALGGNRRYFNFYLRHIGLHLLFFTVLLVFVKVYSSGAYSSEYDVVGHLLISNSKLSWTALSSGVPVIQFMLVCTMILTVFIWIESKHNKAIWKSNNETVLLSMAGIGLFLGFFLINLPWSPLLSKYLLPALFFASMAAVSMQAGIYKLLRKRGFRIIALLWFIGPSLFMIMETGKHFSVISNYYQMEYRYRESVPLIANKIADNLKNQPIQKVIIVSGQLFQEGILPIQRHVNLIHDINIAHEGQVVQEVKSREKNYFRLHPEAPAVEIIHNENISEQVNADDMYVFEEKWGSKKSNKLKKLGYKQNGRWRFGPPAIQIKTPYVARYSRRL